MSSMGLSRSILLSVVTIAAVLAVFASATTFAAFTASDSDSGDVTAGTAELRIGSEASTSGELVFEFNACSGNVGGPIAPGESCSAAFQVFNDGTLDLELDEPTVVVTVSGTCDPLNWTASLETSGTDPLIEGDLIPVGGGSDTFFVNLTLDADPDNECQGETATATVNMSGHNI